MYSVVIPTYNRCQLVAEAIDSVLRQRCPALEIILVDDGSTDGTGQMIARHYPQVRYVYQANAGPAAARNRGIGQARGEIIALLDSDDLWLAHKIEIEQDLLARYPQAGLVAVNARAFVGGHLRTLDTFGARAIQFPGHAPRFFDWSMPIMQQGPVCCTSSMTFRRSALELLGPKPFDESLRFDEDWDLEFRCFSRFPALLYPQPVCHSRIFHDDTRPYYTPAGLPRSSDEQHRIWRQQQSIIARYLNNPHWDSSTEQAFRQRHRQLGLLLGDMQEAQLAS